MRRPTWSTVVLLAAGLCLAASATAGTTKKKPKDQCSNMPGIQKVIPKGYERGSKMNCAIKVPVDSCHTSYDQNGNCLPPAPPAPIAWWPSDYAPWLGGGNAFSTTGHQPLVAYKPAGCNLVNGAQIPNGATDSFGRICWSYLLQVAVSWTSTGKTGCGDIFVKLQELSGGVIVGDTIGSASNVPNNQPVLVHGSVSPQGFPNMTLNISSIDCYSP